MPKARQALRLTDIVPMKMSGFCSFPSPGSHGFCHEKGAGKRGACECPCHVADEPPSMDGFDETVTPPALAPVPDSTEDHRPVGRVRSPKPPRVVVHAEPTAAAVFPASYFGLQPDAPTVKVHLPHRFYRDYETRHEELAGRVVKVLVQSIYVELDAVAYDSLMADAGRYVTGGTREFEGSGGLISSAKATMRALTKAGRPG